MQVLPVWMYIDGIVYYYSEWQGEGECKEWYFCGLFPNKDEKGVPPNVKLKNGSYVYLCSAEFSMEDAHRDLLERINNMYYGI